MLYITYPVAIMMIILTCFSSIHDHHKALISRATRASNNLLLLYADLLHHSAAASPLAKGIYSVYTRAHAQCTCANIAQLLRPAQIMFTLFDCNPTACNILPTRTRIS